MMKIGLSNVKITSDGTALGTLDLQCKLAYEVLNGKA